MKNFLPIAALCLALPAYAQEVPAPATPSSVIAAASVEEWIAIPAEDLLVMELAPDADGDGRTVIIQLMPAPFSQPWVENIRTLARAQYWDGSSINRVQDNYVVQWGQPDDGFGGTVKPVPEGLNVVPEECYEALFDDEPRCQTATAMRDHEDGQSEEVLAAVMIDLEAVLSAAQADYGSSATVSRHPKGNGAISLLATASSDAPDGWRERDSYAEWVEFNDGWPLAARQIAKDDGGFEQWSFWPTHCYGMVGVGRDVSPDTGDGSQLYTVIGHAPRHLDRNIALVGRVISGIEHLTTLPRGTGPLGFYETAQELVPILSARIAADIANPPEFEYLDTSSASFERYIAVRANRQDDFYNVPAGGVDICNVPVPIRPVSE